MNVKYSKLPFKLNSKSILSNSLIIVIMFRNQFMKYEILIICIFILLNSCKNNPIAPMNQLITGDYELCYQKPYNGNWEVFINNITGTNPENISNYLEDDDEYPQWSPDGKYIVYSRQVPIMGPWVIVYSVQSKKEINLTPDGMGGSQIPKWTPNGKVYFYYSNDYGDYHGMFVMNPDGSNKKKILDIDVDIYFYSDSYNFLYTIIDMDQYSVYKSNIDNTVNEFIADLKQTVNHDVSVNGFNPYTEELLTSTMAPDSISEIGLYNIKTNAFNPLIKSDRTTSFTQYTFSNDYKKIAFVTRTNDGQRYLSIYKEDIIKRLLTISGNEWFDWNPMQFSPDDKYIAFSKNVFGSGPYLNWKSYLYVADVSSGVTQIIDEGICPSWKKMK